MAFPHLRLSGPSLPTDHLPLSPLLSNLVFCAQFRASMKKSIYHASFGKNESPALGLTSLARTHAYRAMDILYTEETSDLWECFDQKIGIDLYEQQTLTDEVQFSRHSNSRGSSTDLEKKEIDRRKKIGIANKGKVPWNKGRKHSAETRERIRQRTKEAMMDPKVRRKMSECPRAHSEQTKEKIGSALRRLWGERLKWKKSRTNFLLSWAESIAEAARKGGSDQHELDWDSYDRIKEEIALQQFQWAAEREKAKELAKIRAAQVKAEKMARLAERRKEQETKAKAKGEMNRKTHRKSKEEREVLAVAQGLKLKEKLTKIHKRKSSTNGQITSEDQRAWEKIDLDFIKIERARREVSLADQIQAAKSKRLEAGKRSLPTSSSPRSNSEETAE
ncbi:uncharacterized protein LOC127792040 [Diospyros lotus]|uniref:uncharacterized protein LOC127792040 n=1 Tax=Diospyros lotus TaxID=55363 RepID=UPI00225C1CC2|nr:uncharacterized protein LOC127792040 [Diospyros lotus]